MSVGEEGDSSSVQIYHVVLSLFLCFWCEVVMMCTVIF